MRYSAAFALVLLLGCNAARAESAKDGVVAGNQKFMQAYAKGDGAGIGGLYATDGALLPPGEDRVDGRDAIGAYWQGAIDAGFKDVKLETIEVTEGGDTAAEVGHWSIAAPDGKGGMQAAGGKYLVLWKHGDGGWQIYRDMWNDDPASPK